jgi:hypothetical protein
MVGTAGASSAKIPNALAPSWPVLSGRKIMANRISPLLHGKSNWEIDDNVRTGTDKADCMLLCIHSRKNSRLSIINSFFSI